LAAEETETEIGDRDQATNRGEGWSLPDLSVSQAFAFASSLFGPRTNGRSITMNAPLATVVSTQLTNTYVLVAPY